MSFVLEGLGGRPDLDVNLIPGASVFNDASDEELVLRFRIGKEEAVVSVESFCMLAERYLSGGVAGWDGSGGASGVMPVCVRDTIKRLVQRL